METLMTAVCEDNEREYQELLSVIGRTGIPCACERFPDGPSFLAAFYPGRYDLIFMDIYMDGMTGVETVSRLRARDDRVPVAFVTTSRDHALDGYRLRVSRYLQKPLRAEEVEEVLSYALREKRNEPGLVFTDRQGEHRIPCRQIRYVEQSNHNLTVYLTGGRSLKLRGRLDELETRLPVPPFCRCHKSYLVNLTQVRYLDREINAFAMNEGGAAYIRRASLRDAARALESVIFDETRNR